MRLILISLLLSLTTIAFSQVREQSVKSEIKRVTVYLKGAQVTRQFSCQVAGGKSQLVVPDLPANINENSIQIKADNQKVKVLGVSSRLNYLETRNKPEKIKQLENERALLQDEVDQTNSWIQVYNEEEALLKTNKSIGGQQNGVSIEELKQAAEYFRQRLSDIKSKQLKLNKKLQELRKEIGHIDSQLSELNNKKVEPVREVLLKVSSEQSLSSLFTLSYTVSEAGWLPSYDIRATNVNSPVAVMYKANVHQNTGEDWENVKLTFSNADPSSSGIAPDLIPWYLGFNNHYRKSQVYMQGGGVTSSGEISGRVLNAEDGTPLPGVNVVIQGSTIGTVTNLDGFYSIPVSGYTDRNLVFSFIGLKTQQVPIGNRRELNINLNPDVSQLSEVVVTGYARSKSKRYEREKVESFEEDVDRIVAATPVVKQTTLEFDVKDPYTIKSGDKTQTVDMVEYDLSATYQYYSVPKLDTDAFLTARVTDWEDYNFIPGEASLFFEGKYIGKTILNTEHVEDTLAISLGRDKNISINREKVKDYSSNQYIGGNKKELVAFEIKIRNKKAQPVNVILEDQVPVSNTKEIEIEVMELSGAKHNKTNGKLKWELELKPGETKTLKFVYEVKYPKDKLLALE